MGKRYEVSYLAVAKKDLFDIILYISDELCAPEAAFKLADRFEEAISVLEDFPLSGYIYKHTKGLKDEYRVLVVESYLVFYVVMNNAVEIRRIVYSKRDHNSLL
ncbi:type II toxin-antitoxin system RelE/ParE family toxin [Paenibacillus sp. SN-8-1]|uniref:type II toxin-antitoxin system RelE/ParE family toxin n=1 Tax=Paenibacillus sp. SN-8-1 TaxID=3435409 RepID=UPI003D9A2FCE